MTPTMKKQERADDETFKRIFIEHWDGFKPANPSFDFDQYEEPVKKMRGCGV